MSGLDRIVEEIRRQAQLEADEILREAEEYCSTYLADEKQKADNEVEEYNKKTALDRELYETKSKSGMEFKERNALLNTKQECILECIDKSISAIRELPDEEYFDCLIKILEKNVHDDEGIMLLGKNDIHRLPETFPKRVADIAGKHGGSLNIWTENNDATDEANANNKTISDYSLKLSKRMNNINDGFILIYGNIEENCTLDSLFTTKREELKDAAYRVLFADEKSD